LLHVILGRIRRGSTARAHKTHMRLDKPVPSRRPRRPPAWICDPSR